MNHPFIKNLATFNRKERFLLLSQAIGHAFCLDKKFCEVVGNSFGVQVPRNAYFAIDYHLDWLYVAAFLAYRGREADTYPLPEGRGLMTSTQEDIDFLIVFEDEIDKNTAHLLLLEAKGFTNWQRSQLESKAGRLKAIFSEFGEQRAGVGLRILPRFAVVSFSEPKRLNRELLKITPENQDAYPEWMRENNCLIHIPLERPNGLRQPMRCDAIDGTHTRWTIRDL